MKFLQNFVKRNLLDLKSKLPYLMGDMTHLKLSEYSNTDLLKMPMDFWTAKLCHFYVQKNKLDTHDLNEQEKMELNRSLEILEDFHKLDNFLTYSHKIYGLSYNLKNYFLIQESASNLVSYQEETSG